MLIDIYVGVDDPVSAAEILRSFKALAGNEAESLRRLANLYLRTERFGLAAKVLNQLVAAEPAKADDPGLVEQVVKSSAFRSALRSAGTVIGREITRSIFGTARRR